MRNLFVFSYNLQVLDLAFLLFLTFIPFLMLWNNVNKFCHEVTVYVLHNYPVPSVEIICTVTCNLHVPGIKIYLANSQS